MLKLRNQRVKEERVGLKKFYKNVISKYLRYNLTGDVFLSYNVEKMNFLLKFLLIQMESEHRRHAVSQNIKENEFLS